MQSDLKENPIIQKILARFPESEPLEFRGDLMVTVHRDDIPELLPFLRDDPGLAFDYLVDITAVDRLHIEEDIRFAVVYHFYSFEHGHRLRVKALVPEDDSRIFSAVSLWKAANWLEREVYDMFGIEFDGHPNLARILMPDYFQGHPLRKDYPLRGRGERENFDFD